MPNITHNLLLGLSTGDHLINLIITIPEPEVFYKCTGNSDFQVKKRETSKYIKTHVANVLDNVAMLDDKKKTNTNTFTYNS